MVTSIGFQTSPIKKILVVRNDNMGDVVCTTPCFEALRKHFPDAFIATLVCRVAEEVVLGNPFLDKVYVYDKAKHGRYRFVLHAWWKQLQVIHQIRRAHFDLAIGIRSEFSHSLGWLVYTSGAPCRVGRGPKGKNKKYSFFYNVYVDPPKKGVHEVDRSLDVLRHIGVDIEEKHLFLKLLTTNTKKAKGFFSKHHINSDKPVVCVNFNRRMEEGRYWNYQHYVALIKRLLSEGVQTIVTCGPEERAVFGGLLRASACEAPFWCSNSLKDFGAVVAQCSVFVTIDGGPMHVAAAVGTPAVVLFGKNDPVIWSPWGTPHKILRNKDGHNVIQVNDVFEATKAMIKYSQLVPVQEEGLINGALLRRKIA